MNPYQQFLVAIIQSLGAIAWPALFGYAIWLFRDPLRELLERLSLMQFKYKGVGMSFSLRMKQAEQLAASTAGPPEVPDAQPIKRRKTNLSAWQRFHPLRQSQKVG